MNPYDLIEAGCKAEAFQRALKLYRCYPRLGHWGVDVADTGEITLTWSVFGHTMTVRTDGTMWYGAIDGDPIGWYTRPSGVLDACRDLMHDLVVETKQTAEHRLENWS